MAPDSTFPAATIPKPDTPSRSKFRVRFAKLGDLRFVSHHDLMHVFERIFRRAELPIPTSQGFNPRPRMWFAAPLALGIAGLNEVLEFEVAAPLSADEVQDRLVRQLPPGLAVNSVRAIDVKRSAHVRRALYRMTCEPADGVAIASRCQAFLQQQDHLIERLRPQRRRFNLRPYVDELRVDDGKLAMALWVTPNGAARPDEVVAALGLQDQLAAGAVIERSDLEIYDELPPDTKGPPPMHAGHDETVANDGASLEPAGAGRPTAIIDSPFSFDS
jgi:radical SAM-linked protein